MGLTTRLRAIVALAAVLALAGCSLDLAHLRGSADAGVLDAGDAASLVDADLDADVDAGDLGPDDARAPDAGPRDDAGPCNAGCMPSLAFAPAYFRTLGFVPVALDTGDVNGDGAPDVVIVGPGTFQVFTLDAPDVCRLRTLTASASFTMPFSASTLEVADLEMDGRDDIALLAISGELSLYRATGTGGFDASDPAMFDSPSFGVVASGSPPRLVVTAGSGATGSIGTFDLVWPNLNMGSPPVPPIAALGRAVSVRRSSTENLVAAASSSDAHVYLFRVDGSTPTIEGMVSTPGTALRLVAADLDLDGIDEVVTNVIGQRKMYVLSNPGSGWTALPVNLDEFVDALASGNLGADGRPDIVALRGSTVRVYPVRDLSESGGPFDSPVSLALPGLGIDVAVADLDGDALPDVLTIGADGAGGYELRIFPGRCL